MFNVIDSGKEVQISGIENEIVKKKLRRLFYLLKLDSEDGDSFFRSQFSPKSLSEIFQNSSEHAEKGNIFYIYLLDSFTTPNSNSTAKIEKKKSIGPTFPTVCYFVIINITISNKN